MSHNHLQDEPSLYLRQHADNPVDWRTWGDQALAEARECDRPLFISSGYSSCHWCHVMAHESFADSDVATILNRDFIPIKIDREEHPSVDAQYMLALMLIQGHGGWPMNVFALPDGRPFFAGTYYPKQPRKGLPGFIEILERVANAWRQERDGVIRDAEQIAQGVYARSQQRQPADLIADGIHAAVGESLKQAAAGAQKTNGPQFPPHADLRLWQHLLSCETQNTATLDQWVREVTDRLCWSGLRDQLGGAFHRYCVDAHWRLPHFEQMLYDNAQMLQNLALIYHRDRDEADRWVLQQLLLDLQTRWQTEARWFAASWDADDPGGEGAYYTWTPEELDQALLDDSVWAQDYFQVDATGCIDGRSTLYPQAPPNRWPQEAAAETWAHLRHITPLLRAVREQRPEPARDDKGIVAENGMLLRALAQAAGALGNDVLTPFAAAADVCLARSQSEPLPRTWYPGVERGLASIADYAALAHGLLHWGLRTDNQAFVGAAWDLAKRMIDRFSTPQWRSDQGALPLGAPLGVYDGQHPAPFALAAECLLDLYAISGATTWREALDSLFHHCSGTMAATPALTKDLWRVRHRDAQPAITVMLCGDKTAAWQARLQNRGPATAIWIPPTITAWLQEQDTPAAINKRAGYAYCCYGMSCDEPAASLATLAEQLTTNAP